MVLTVILFGGISALASADPAGELPVIKLEPAAPLTDAQSPTLETVVVTAQRKLQAAQDVPLSVTAIWPVDLEQEGGFDASTLENFAPNVELDIDAQAPVLGVRGFSTDTDNVGFEPAVGLFVDEVALGRPEFIADGLFDLSGIEVIRGPQGTLFGKNTSAGVLALRSTEPQVDLNGRLLMTADPYGGERLEAAQNLALGRATALRVAGVAWNQAGRLENTTRDERQDQTQQRAARIKLASELTDALSIHVSTQFSRARGTYGPLQLYDASAAALDFSRRYDAQVEDDPRNERTSQDVAGFVDRDSNLSRVIISDQLDSVLGFTAVTSSLIAGYAGFHLDALIDADVSPASLVITDFGIKDRQRSIEWRLSGERNDLFGVGDAASLVVGVYALGADLTSHLDAVAGTDLVAFADSPAGLSALGGPNLSALLPLFALLPTAPDLPLNDALLRDFSQRTTSYAAFSQMDWTLNEAWTAFAGLRVTREKKRARFDVAKVGPGIIATILGASDFERRVDLRELNVSPRLGLTYRWSDSVSYFSSVTRGFKGGGFNAIANTDQDLAFGPERVTSYETGTRTVWLDRRVRLNLTAFYAHITDLQVVDLLGNSLKVGNAARARSTGFELEASWLTPAPWLRLDAAAGFDDATYLRYRNAVPTAAQSDNGATTQDLSGRTLANAPRASLRVAPTFTVPHARTFGLDTALSVNAVYRGQKYSATDLDPHSRQSGYWLLGTSLQFGASSHAWTLCLSGNNLTDRKALDSVIDNAVYANTQTAEQIPPRSVQLSWMANW